MLSIKNINIFNFESPSLIVKTNIQQNLIQGLASSIFNNVDKFIFANILSVNTLLTVDFAYKVRAIIMKGISSISNVWFTKLHNKSNFVLFQKLNLQMGVFYIIAFSGILFFLDSIGALFNVIEINKILFSILVLPSFFVIVMFKMRIMNVKTLKLRIVTVYRIIEGLLRSVIIPILIIYYGIFNGFGIGYILSLLLLGFGVYKSHKQISGSGDIALFLMIILYSICLSFVL